VNLAVPHGAPLMDSEGTDAAITGWKWFPIQGTQCRDGSQNGIYLHRGTVNKLIIYMEGGGACSSQGFCDHNPANLDQQFIAGGETVLGSTFVVPIHQQPSGLGIFDFSKTENPFKDWSQVYVPYCTGDVHFGAREQGTVPGYNGGPQKFVGKSNTEKFIARVVPTFPNPEQVIVTGASAGAYGAGLNYGMIQDTYGPSVPVWALLDSGTPFKGDYIAPCLLRGWWDTWGFEEALPSDCTECRDNDRAGVMNIIDYWRRKYPSARVGLISSVHDEIIRLFYSAGNNDCANADPVALFISTFTLTYDPARYQEALLDLRTRYQDTGQFATYYVSAFGKDTLHQHIFRDRFYEATAGTSMVTMAQWTSDFLAGNMTHVGP
jgi:hypothetical protein